MSSHRGTCSCERCLWRKLRAGLAEAERAEERVEAAMLHARGQGQAQGGLKGYTEGKDYTPTERSADHEARVLAYAARAAMGLALWSRDSAPQVNGGCELWRAINKALPEERPPDKGPVRPHHMRACICAPCSAFRFERKLTALAAAKRLGV